VNNCDFRHYRESAFTHEFLIGCEDSVFMHWRGNDLETISVREGWKGQTDRGIMIGDPIEKFLEVYPEAQHKRDPPGYKIYEVNYLVVSFDKNDKIDMMSLNNRNVDDFDYSSLVEPWQTGL